MNCVSHSLFLLDVITCWTDQQYINCLIITGPLTHSVGGQTSNGHWCLSSSFVICNAAGGQVGRLPGAWVVRCSTWPGKHHGEYISVDSKLLNCYLVVFIICIFLKILFAIFIFLMCSPALVNVQGGRRGRTVLGFPPPENCKIIPKFQPGLSHSNRRIGSLVTLIGLLATRFGRNGLITKYQFQMKYINYCRSFLKQ